MFWRGKRREQRRFQRGSLPFALSDREIENVRWLLGFRRGFPMGRSGNSLFCNKRCWFPQFIPFFVNALRFQSRYDFFRNILFITSSKDSPNIFDIIP